MGSLIKGKAMGNEQWTMSNGKLIYKDGPRGERGASAFN
jgi:hypothetical protein